MNRLNLQFLFEERIEKLKNELSNKTTRVISNKLIKRTISNLEKALKILDKEISRGIITADAKKKILSLISNKNLKENMIEFIDEYDNHKMDYLRWWMCDRIRENLSGYRKILKRYHINDTFFSERIIFKYDEEELNDLLDKLVFKYGIGGDAAYRTLFYSDVHRVYHVLDLMNKYPFVFDREFDIDLFIFKLCDLNSDACDNFESNMSFLSMIGVNPSIYYYVAIRLIRDKKILTDNFLTLSSYGLFDAVKEQGDVMTFILLATNNLENKLDNILEMGCYDFLKKDLFSLCTDNTKRLQVLKCMGTPVFDQETYKTTMNTDNFIVADKDIDSEIYSAVSDSNIKLNININDLESFKVPENELLYSIGGVLVSVNKVKRLVDEGNDIYTSIVTGLILSDEEYNSMMDVLQPLQYNK